MSLTLDAAHDDRGRGYRRRADELILDGNLDVVHEENLATLSKVEQARVSRRA